MNKLVNHLPERYDYQEQVFHDADSSKQDQNSFHLDQ